MFSYLYATMFVNIPMVEIYWKKLAKLNKCDSYKFKEGVEGMKYRFQLQLILIMKIMIMRYKFVEISKVWMTTLTGNFPQDSLKLPMLWCVQSTIHCPWPASAAEAFSGHQTVQCTMYIIPLLKSWKSQNRYLISYETY